MSNDFHEGKLKRWNDDRGFGFIGLEDGKGDIFIHISALSRMSRRPIAGDTITYQIQTNSDGKKRAANAKIKGVVEVQPRPPRTSTKKGHTKKQNERSFLSSAELQPLANPTSPPRPIRTKVATRSSQKQKKGNWLSKITLSKVASLLLLIIFGSIAYSFLPEFDRFHTNSGVSAFSPVKKENNNRFRCEGKVYCSQMTSCGEAVFYLRNCTGTKMDGAGDGVPCERQWCGW